MHKPFALVAALTSITSPALARADDAAPAGLAAFRTHCKAPAAKLVIDEASLSPHYGKDRDWPFELESIRARIDDLLYLVGGACDPDDRMMIEWKIADRIVESKAGGGTRFDRPERPVPVERFAGVREIRVVFDARYLARKSFVEKGGDHRDWLKKELAGRVDPRLVDEDLRDVMAVSGMPPAIALADGVLTIGVAPPTQIDMPLDRLFVRVVDLALGPKPTAPAKK
ncbi:hypothetical protein L6R52_30600 [Myxococcota bacterium]|nr:hypothetical protein [Myxococcota bacterium]